MNDEGGGEEVEGNIFYSNNSKSLLREMSNLLAQMCVIVAFRISTAFLRINKFCSLHSTKYMLYTKASAIPTNFVVIFFLAITALVALAEQHENPVHPKSVVYSRKGSMGKQRKRRYGSLEWFVHPLSPDVFLKHYFELNPVIFSREHMAYYDTVSHSEKKQKSLEPLGNIFHHIQDSAYDKICPKLSSTQGFPSIRATSNGKDVKPFRFWDMPEIKQGYDPETIAKEQKHYKTGQVWDKDALQYTHAKGFSTLFIRTEQWESKVAAPFLKDAAKTLGIYTQMNVYVTPANSVGFVSHFDSHDVFVLQLYGSKNWRVYDNPPVILPANDWPRKRIKRYMKIKNHSKRLINNVLKQGDALYIPRGYIHDADCKDLKDDSVHVSIGFFAPLFADLVHYGLDLLPPAVSHKVNLSYVDRLLLEAVKVSSKNPAVDEYATVLRASPSLPFAVDYAFNGRQKNRLNNFNMYKLAVESCFKMLATQLPSYALNNKVINTEKDFVSAEIEDIRLSLINVTLWETIIKTYKVNLNEFVENGFDKFAVYCPVSHAAQEVRDIKTYDNKKRKKKRKHRHRRKK